MPPEPIVSVVVATFNRAAILARTLACLLAQDFDHSAYEIIVVDDGSSDDTARVVHSLAAEAPVPLRYFAHPNRGPGYSQNVGIRAARGHLVLLIADDIFLTQGALAAHVRLHEHFPNPRVAALGKAVTSPDLSGTGFLNERDAFGLDRFEHCADRSELPHLLFWAFNLSFKRSLMLEAGMFREPRGRAGPRAHEDTELGCRLHRSGLILLYAKEAVAYHYHPTTLEQVANVYRERGLNYPDLIAHSSDPLLPVFFRVLQLGSLREYRRSLRRCGWLTGRDRYFGWHLARHAARSLLFNKMTVPIIWRPLLRQRRASGSRGAAIQARVCGPYLFHHFLAGIRDARSRFGPPLDDRRATTPSP